jgi:hypothetical protein
MCNYAFVTLIDEEEWTVPATQYATNTRQPCFYAAHTATTSIQHVRVASLVLFTAFDVIVVVIHFHQAIRLCKLYEGKQKINEDCD